MRARPHAHRRTRRRIAALALSGILAGGLALAQQGLEFIPDGGRTLLINTFDADSARIAELAGMDLAPDGWRDLIAESGADLTDVQATTLAGYLDYNMPLADPEALAGLEDAEIAEALPRDGRDLALRHCQSCHGLFSGYLAHDRDQAGWESTFRAPFHLEIPMNETEIRTFAHYSEHNMPLGYDEVPPEWRF